MFSFSHLRSPRPSQRKRYRPLKLDLLEHRRVLAGAIDTCVPLTAADLPDLPAEESVLPPFGGEIRSESFEQKARPFQISGLGFATDGLPLVPGLTASFSSTGTATGLGKYTGNGTFTLGSLAIDASGAVSGTFQGTFVFVAANGDQLAVVFGDGFSGTFKGQLSADGASVEDIEFDAIFSPDPDNSSGRYLDVVGGGWRMIAEADSVGLIPGSPVSATFDFSWSGVGTLEFAY